MLTGRPAHVPLRLQSTAGRCRRRSTRVIAGATQRTRVPLRPSPEKPMGWPISRPATIPDLQYKTVSSLNHRRIANAESPPDLRVGSRSTDSWFPIAWSVVETRHDHGVSVGGVTWASTANLVGVERIGIARGMSAEISIGE